MPFLIKPRNFKPTNLCEFTVLVLLRGLVQVTMIRFPFAGLVHVTLICFPFASHIWNWTNIWIVYQSSLLVYTSYTNAKEDVHTRVLLNTLVLILRSGKNCTNQLCKVELTRQHAMYLSLFLQRKSVLRHVTHRRKQISIEVKIIYWSGPTSFWV